MIDMHEQTSKSRVQRRTRPARNSQTTYQSIYPPGLLPPPPLPSHLSRTHTRTHTRTNLELALLLPHLGHKHGHRNLHLPIRVSPSLIRVAVSSLTFRPRLRIGSAAANYSWIDLGGASLIREGCQSLVGNAKQPNADGRQFELEASGNDVSTTHTLCWGRDLVASRRDELLPQQNFRHISKSESKQNRRSVHLPYHVVHHRRLLPFDLLHSLPPPDL